MHLFCFLVQVSCSKDRRAVSLITELDCFLGEESSKQCILIGLPHFSINSFFVIFFPTYAQVYFYIVLVVGFCIIKEVHKDESCFCEVPIVSYYRLKSNSMVSRIVFETIPAPSQWPREY